MKFEVRIKQLGNGAFQARYIGGKVESITVSADTRDAALERMKQHLRYHLEYCPCSGVSDEFIELVPVEEKRSPPWR